MEHSKRFTGRIGKTLSDSTSSWEESASGLRRKPNIVMIVLDDVGYSNFGCYGGDIDTPALDGLAEGGLQYTNFHVTPLCSPTRTCLLTGRNHHSLGMGRVAEMDNGFPNTRGFAARDAANLAEILRPQGYQTLAAGKWHLVAIDDTSPAGPYSHWPLQRGFDRFFGFLPGETSQWHPELILGNERVQQPDREGYHLSEDIVDHSCRWLRQLASADPDKPFFLYVAFGAGHSPHHAPPEYIEKYRGRFDDGWDAARQRTIERQRASGLMASDQELAPRNPGVQVWDELDADEKRVAARFQEAFAGFVDHADVQIGRLLKQLGELGKDDDTIVLAIADNGASAEGGPHGSYDQQRSRNGLRTSVAENLERLDDIGGPLTNNQYPFGWAMAGNTPFKRYKGNTYGGGVRAPLLLRWPVGIPARGEMRRQFYHVVDVTPTILDILGLDLPARVGGVEQIPLHGVSMAHTFGEDDAQTYKETQYFETIGQRGIWHRGWKAVTFHRPGSDFGSDPWELYNLDVDIAERNDLSAEDPQRLEDLISLWWQEAERYGVLPLDDMAGRTGIGWKPDDRSRWVLYQDAVLPHFYRSGPRVLGLSHRITARIERESTRKSGVVISDGGRFGGWCIYVHGNRMHYTTNAFCERCRVSSRLALPPGPVTLRADVVRTGNAEGRVRLFVNEGPAGEGRLGPFRWGNFVNEPLTVGFESQTPVDDVYEPPFTFDGRIVDVVIETVGKDVVDEGVLLDQLMGSQ